MLNIERPGADLAQQLHVLVDGGRLFRKLPHEVVAKLLAPCPRVIHLVADVEAIVFLVHRRPLELAVGQEVEHLARAGLRAHITDVVHTDVPLVAIAFIGMRVAACCVVLFEHADLPTQLAQQGCRCQAAHAAADHDGVVGLGKPARPVAVTDA